MQLKEYEGFPIVKYLLIPHDFFGLPHIKRKVIFKNYLIISCYQPRPQRRFSLKEKGEKKFLIFFKKMLWGGG